MPGRGLAEARSAPPAGVIGHLFCFRRPVNQAGLPPLLRGLALCPPYISHVCALSKHLESGDPHARGAELVECLIVRAAHLGVPHEKHSSLRAKLEMPQSVQTQSPAVAGFLCNHRRRWSAAAARADAEKELSAPPAIALNDNLPYDSLVQWHPPAFGGWPLGADDLRSKKDPLLPPLW